ncbi:MAG: mechanosensitive ion channel MscS, small conductance mechanosensitive channel [Candidatus Saccharibacteria bacterium]|nr:mechanosensitive ion channel MscS, small conductance mechanosensitive channel [Candidatus Saccharibacteria bacterium]
MSILASGNTDQAVKQTTEHLQQVTHSVLNVQSILVFVLSITVALVVGRLAATLLRRLVAQIGARADKSENLGTVNRLRRYETFIVLSIAVIRTMLLIFAVYFWWLYSHPSGQPTAIIGASALAALLVSGALSPALRDLAAGSYMMAEQWYGVGDYIKVEPFGDMQGVVERVTLRSTRIRGLNGEIIWVNNQNIQGVRLTPRGIRTLALEMFVDDEAAGEKLINMTNRRLPTGPLLMVSPLQITSSEKVGDNLWHITALGDTGPGREWLIEQSAVDLIKSLDEKSRKPVIAHGPLARFADSEAERRFRRTVSNARKKPKPKRRPGVKKPSTKKKR